MGLGNLRCDGIDELPRDKGCQVRCEQATTAAEHARSPKERKRCPRGRKACAKLHGCVRMNTNSEGTWATLKGRVPQRGSGPEMESHWCAPVWNHKCTASDALCAVFASSLTAPDLYTSRPHNSVPHRVPAVMGTLLDYPRRRHAAIVHLAFVHDHYDRLPSAVALLIDTGDRHLSSGSDVCAQSLHLAEIARMCESGALKGRRASKSLSPTPDPPAAHAHPIGRNGSHATDYAALRAAATRRFTCARHVLTAAQKRAWSALLAGHLGPPPRAVWSYAGKGELLATREAILSVPRPLYARLLATLLERKSAHADALQALLPHVWAALLGGAYDKEGGFACDHEHGWAVPRVSRADEGARAPLPLPRLRPPSLLAHDRPGMEAALRKAPRAPSALERATGCGPSSLMCVVIAAHKENLAWAKRLGHPTVVYRRHRSTTEPFVVPNVFHEHAVYLRYICAFYDRLPRLTAFLHGHATSWHNHNSASSQLLQMDLAAAARAGQVYRSFNDYKECWRDGRGEWHDEMLAQAQGWAREMAPFVGAEPPLKESYCCTQFVVSADRIRARPHAFWRHLLADLLDPAVPQVCKVSGHVLELTWGLLLGEPANATCRRDGWGATGDRVAAARAADIAQEAAVARAAVARQEADATL